MINVIPITDAPPLHQLLGVFNADSLGEGNVLAGTNVLAAMCASIANLRPPGTCLVTPDGDRLAVGMSFAAAGGLTRSLVAEKVLEPLAVIQNNLGDHHAAAGAYDAAKLAALAPHERDRIRPPAPTENPEMVNVDLQINGIALVRDSTPFQRLLAPCSSQGMDEITKNPAVFLDASSAAGLEKQLLLAHRRYPYIRASLPDGPGTEALERLLLSVIRGTSVTARTAGAVHIRGHVAATCAPAKLAQSVEAGEGSLLGSLLWLIDGEAGATTLAACKTNDSTRGPTYLRYLELLHRVWAERLDYRVTQGSAIGYDWTRRQREWVAHLQNLERNCPGITLAARPLFATLIYGLLHLRGGRKGEPPGWTATGVLDMAKLLAGRMAQCRQRIIQTDQNSRGLELAIKLVSKLVGGPLDERGIVRKTNRLLIADCREALEILYHLGVIRRVEGNKWELSLPAPQAVAKLRAPSFDV